MADPTARGCPKVKRIVARAAAATGCRNSATQPIKASASVIKAVGYSLGCDSNTVFNQVTAKLLRTLDSKTWTQMDVQITTRHDANPATAFLAFTKCHHTDFRLYRTTAVSYSKNKAGTAFVDGDLPLPQSYYEQLLRCA